MPASALPRGVAVGALTVKADFERLLQVRWRCRSAHFAIHHVCGRPTAARRVAARSEAAELSTTPAPGCPQPVDDCSGHWLGCMVPKRHARRAVTRNLIKRQARSLFAQRAPALPPGLWLLRLRAPFDRSDFASAASTALRCAVRTELDALLLRASVEPA